MEPLQGLLVAVGNLIEIPWRNNSSQVVLSKAILFSCFNEHVTMCIFKFYFGGSGIC